MRIRSSTLALILVALVAGSAGGGCILTNPLGIRPLGSVPGSEARILVQNAASAGLVAGISFHNLLRKSKLTFDVELLEDSIVTGFLAKFYVTTEIKPDAFYTRRSVTRCIERVTIWSMMWTIYILDFDANKEANDRNNTVALGGVAACELEPTGTFVHVGNSVSF